MATTPEGDTHWAFCDGLAKRWPAVRLDPDPVFIRNGDVWTSAGVTAGMDLALVLVEDDLGSEVALKVARLLVVFLRRSGRPVAVLGALAVRKPPRPALRGPAGADSRAPRRRPDRGRAGRALLDDGAESLEAVARAAGFSGTEVLRRAFHRRVGVGPAAHRERFRLGV